MTPHDTVFVLFVPRHSSWGLSLLSVLAFVCAVVMAAVHIGPPPVPSLIFDGSALRKFC